MNLLHPLNTPEDKEPPRLKMGGGGRNSPNNDVRFGNNVSADGFKLYVNTSRKGSGEQVKAALSEGG